MVGGRTVNALAGVDDLAQGHVFAAFLGIVGEDTRTKAESLVEVFLGEAIMTEF